MHPMLVRLHRGPIRRTAKTSRDCIKTVSLVPAETTLAQQYPSYIPLDTPHSRRSTLLSLSDVVGHTRAPDRAEQRAPHCHNKKNKTSGCVSLVLQPRQAISVVTTARMEITLSTQIPSAHHLVSSQADVAVVAFRDLARLHRPVITGNELETAARDVCVIEWSARPVSVRRGAEGLTSPHGCPHVLQISAAPSAPAR